MANPNLVEIEFADKELLTRLIKALEKFNENFDKENDDKIGRLFMELFRQIDTDKPEWWPENPYFESAMASIKNDDDYAKAIPDPNLRTAVSWYLGNQFWELASKSIFKALIENSDDDNSD